MPKVMVGVFARRNPDGSFLPSQPIYRDMTDEEAQKAKENMLSGLTELVFKQLYGCRLSHVREGEETLNE